MFECSDSFDSNANLFIDNSLTEEIGEQCRGTAAGVSMPIELKSVVHMYTRDVFARVGVAEFAEGNGRRKRWDVR